MHYDPSLHELMRQRLFSPKLRGKVFDIFSRIVFIAQACLLPVVLHHVAAGFGQIVHFVLAVGVDSSLVVSLLLSSKPSM